MIDALKPDPVPAVIEAFARGEVVLVTDDDDRENEGDLFVAASHCTTEAMAFIVRHTSGIVCAPMPAEEARRLRLAPMVADNDAPLGTAFTVSVDARHGTTTGISAEERTNTVRSLANGNMGAADFVRPGHVFPLIAREGGVLMRSGHTEACVDMCRLAGLPLVGVLAELVNDDGTVMKGPQLTAFAARHGLKSLTVADLIAHRQARERLVERIASFPVSTPHGELVGHAYRTPFDAVQHFAFVMGAIGDGRDVPARLHRANVIEDVLGGGRAVNACLARLAQGGRGVLVYLRDGAVGVPANVPAGGTAGEGAGATGARERQWREVGLGAQVLRDLGVSSIVNLTSSPRGFVGLAGFGITISGTEPVEG